MSSEVYDLHRVQPHTTLGNQNSSMWWAMGATIWLVLAGVAISLCHISARSERRARQAFRDSTASKCPVREQPRLAA